MQQRRTIMKISRVMPVLAFLIAGTLIAQDAKVTPLMSKDLAEFPGKEGLMITVVYPPGASDPIHRHNAHAFLYVLEGSVVMQVKGGKEITLTPGQTFYEGPKDIHTVGRNASSTKPAKFIVFLVKDKGAPVLVPVNPTAAGVSTSPKSNSGRIFSCPTRRARRGQRVRAASHPHRPTAEFASS